MILSPHFFSKNWPQRELKGLAAREVAAPDGKVILPVWHKISYGEVLGHSPTLADKVSGKTDGGIDALADALSLAIKKSSPP